MSAQISIQIQEAEGHTVVAQITYGNLRFRVCAEIRIEGRQLTAEKTHIEGLTPGALGRLGLNALARRIMEEADVDNIVIFGAKRTTGAKKGLKPRPIRFPRV